MNNTILQIENLSKSYGSINALNSLSLKIEKGNVYGILGPNGSGKTTTLSLIMGIIKPNHGSFIWFEEKDIQKIKTRIGSLVETPNFYPYLTAVQNLKIICDIKRICYSDIERVLNIVNLYQRKNSRYYTFSFGMKQRLALSSILLGNPDVLVLDEPTNGLDPEGIAEVRKIILSEAEKGKTIILASHILDEVEKVCTHVSVLKKGQLIANGRVNELLSSSYTVYISSGNLDELHMLILRSGFAKSVERQDNEIALVLHDSYSPYDINEYSFKNGQVLTKLLAQKKSLENQFLELVKK
ncbi:MAG: ATP-binding cassette domain-containing protein [Bacteroidota bacterium]